MKRVAEVTAGKDVNNKGVDAIVIDYTDGTSDYFTLEVDPTNNRRKNFRMKNGSMFARTTKALKRKLGFESGSAGACAIQMAMNREWGYDS